MTVESSSWRWVASVRSQGSHRCGAILLSDTRVLTAASCVSETKQDLLTVAIGDHDRSQAPSVMYVGLISAQIRVRKFCWYYKNYRRSRNRFPVDISIFLHLNDEHLRHLEASALFIPKKLTRYKYIPYNL